MLCDCVVVPGRYEHSLATDEVLRTDQRKDSLVDLSEPLTLLGLQESGKELLTRSTEGPEAGVDKDQSRSVTQALPSLSADSQTVSWESPAHPG